MKIIIDELINACTILNMEYSILQGEEASEFIHNAKTCYNPAKMEGHLAIQFENSDHYSTDEFEFEYSKFLDDEPIFLFFDQSSSEKDVVFKLYRGKSLCDVLQECFGIEYFVTNEIQSYLISVNWYTIEVVGSTQINLLGMANMNNQH